MVKTVEGDERAFNFEGGYGKGYEALARQVIPGYETVFPMIAAIIDPDLERGARVLVVGAGTGIEIVALKRARPDLLVHGVDPSSRMLELAKRRVAEAALADGVSYRLGYASDVPDDPPFDAATLINVLHFVPDHEGDGGKAALLADIARRLRPGGVFVLFDLHGDPGSEEHERYMPAWQRYWRIRGMSSGEAEAFQSRIDAGIRFAPPTRVVFLAEKAGLLAPRRFYKSLLYGGWTFRRAQGSRHRATMSESKRRAAVRRRAAAPLAVVAAMAAALGACADLALEPNQIPDKLMVAPDGPRVVQGDAGQLTATVLDKDGQAIPSPSWAPAEWSISPPGQVGFASDGSFTAAGIGDFTVVARLAGLRGHTSLFVSPPSVVLGVPAVYLNQAIQNLEGGVPLIAGRDAFLRVFVTGDQVSYYEPRAVADIVEDGRVVHSATMGPPHQIPDQIWEGWPQRSFNVEVPGRLIRPGVALRIEIDPAGVVPLGPGSRIDVPPQPLNVVALPAHSQTIVPVLLGSGPSRGIIDWARQLTAESEVLRFARTALPIGEMDLDVREPYVTQANLTTEDGWRALIREIALLRIMDDETGYYYGAAVLPQGSAWGGLGYVGYPVSIGANSSGVFAHELGHNFSLLHAPCGGAGNPDPNFPYRDGSPGVWGYDPSTGAILDPADYRDLMGYCGPDWVSDYSFVKALEYRVRTEGEAAAASLTATAGAGSGSATSRPSTTLLLWGAAGEHGVLLEPAFLTDAQPTLPTAGGPYRLAGFAPGGRTIFSLDFTPAPLEFGGGGFHFAVPYDAARDGALERVVLSGPGGEFVMSAGSASPMAIVTDRGSGKVRAVLRDWRGGLSLVDANTEIMVSDGLPDGER